jgi:hypothetical protein
MAVLDGGRFGRNGHSLGGCCNDCHGGSGGKDEAVRRFLRCFWRGNAPKSLFELAKEPRPKSILPTSKLYVVEVDFEVSPDALDSLQKQLGTIREKYGLDFMILEPGFKLKRFDDF